MVSNNFNGYLLFIFIYLFYKFFFQSESSLKKANMDSNDELGKWLKQLFFPKKRKISNAKEKLRLEFTLNAYKPY